MEATDHVWLERAEELPCPTKIPADEVYLKFEFTYPSNPGDPNFKRLFIFRLKRKSLANLPASVVSEMFESLDGYLYPKPGDDGIFAKLISNEAKLKEQDRAFGVLCELCGMPLPDEMALSYETWTASGTMTRCIDTLILYSRPRFIEVTGTDDVLDQDLNSKTEKYLCSICFRDDKDNDMISALPCMHIFHYQCLVKGMNSSSICPTCRSLILASWMTSEAAFSSLSTADSFRQLICKIGSYVRKLIN